MKSHTLLSEHALARLIMSAPPRRELLIRCPRKPAYCKAVQHSAAWGDRVALPGFSKSSSRAISGRGKSQLLRRVISEHRTRNHRSHVVARDQRKQLNFPEFQCSLAHRDDRVVAGSSRLLRLTFILLWTRPASYNDRRDSTAWAKIAFYFCPDRTRVSHHIFQNAVYNIFLENPKVAVRLQILLERLQFQTVFVGHIPNHNLPKVRQARLWANRGKFRIIYDNLVAGKLVWPNLNSGKIKIKAGFGMFFRIT